MLQPVGQDLGRAHGVSPVTVLGGPSPVLALQPPHAILSNKLL